MKNTLKSIVSLLLIAVLLGGLLFGLNRWTAPLVAAREAAEEEAARAIELKAEDDDIPAAELPADEPEDSLILTDGPGIGLEMDLPPQPEPEPGSVRPGQGTHGRKLS